MNSLKSLLASVCDFSVFICICFFFYLYMPLSRSQISLSGGQTKKSCPGSQKEKERGDFIGLHARHSVGDFMNILRALMGNFGDR